MPRLPDNPDRDFSAGCGDGLQDETVEDMFASYIVGYSQLITTRRSGFASERS